MEAARKFLLFSLDDQRYALEFFDRRNFLTVRMVVRAVAVMLKGKNEIRT